MGIKPQYFLSTVGIRIKPQYIQECY